MNESVDRYPNQRLGLILFFIYLALYLGFMLLCAWAPGVMEWRPIAGLNLALLYGFGLIIFALILALIYGFFSRPDHPPTDSTPTPTASDERTTSDEGTPQ
ncbi:DUF485 domain-containing protein [Planctomycetaceae bacterium SH139]